MFGALPWPCCTHSVHPSDPIDHAKGPRWGPLNAPVGVGRAGTSVVLG